MRTLADLIEFNRANCAAEMEYYGQEVFEMSEATSGDLLDPIYQIARGRGYEKARMGIDTAIETHRLDAIVAPHLTNSSAAAVSGYPNLALPVGIGASGKPAGMLMYSTFLREPQLLGFAYDLEQELNARREPRYLNNVVLPPNAEICGPVPKKRKALSGKARLPQRHIF